MIKQFKQLSKLAVLTAGLLAAAPQTAHANFQPYPVVGQILGGLDPHGVYTASLLCGSLASYILMRTVFNPGTEECTCHGHRGVFGQMMDYGKHVGKTALNLATTGACYAAFSFAEKTAMATSGVIDAAAATTTSISNNTKLGIAALTVTAAAGAALLYKKYKARNNAGDAPAVRFHADADAHADQ